MRSPLRLFLPLLALLLAASSAPASDEGLNTLGSMAIQDDGRIMPLQTYAGRIAVQLTGRSRWSASRGPEAYAGREPMQLLCDLMFHGQDLLRKPLVAVENRPFKRVIGLDAERRFFTPVELATNKGINELLAAYADARLADPQAQPTKDQRRALDIRSAVERVTAFAAGESIAIIPAGPAKPFRRAGPTAADAGFEPVRDALAVLGRAYVAGAPIVAEAQQVRAAIDASGRLEPGTARALKLELFYDKHNPWRITAVFYGLSVLLFGVSRLVLRRPITVVALACATVGIGEHLLGLGLRMAILGRAPVSNTYESLIWMGLVGIAIGLVAQLLNRKGWYLFAGLCAALVSVLFAGMVPLEDRTNALPAVLRSNFWLTLHVLTIVASYGVLAVASVLGHVYLAKDVLLARCNAFNAAKRSAPLIVQTYRTLQVGLILLTAGTILGGVWAAESWGRFWGWDPKETWALISIITYFAVLHARYIRWLQDFGLAAASILGFVVIVWTFYGVNYVMATGLHSYGFGSGGEVWVGLWAVLETAFLVACRFRFAALRQKARESGAPAVGAVASAM